MIDSSVVLDVVTSTKMQQRVCLIEFVSLKKKKKSLNEIAKLLHWQGTLSFIKLCSIFHNPYVNLSWQNLVTSPGFAQLFFWSLS